ncbi:uncharacterized protein B0H18DRAFT_1039240 [Fomitopsis serialis]|uniref:uncharacterized protein n=1 Tax=Fomitopsis serialis TaxID=139415 RepID=UPI002007256C|nr:uncharacterized protein B0H18DRAFT_1039240 [Neoantrodia serialis]KAH9916020.1 hypothetical protein B0H18DRAFT_1039240 [Neoantrodia serialis]
MCTESEVGMPNSPPRAIRPPSSGVLSPRDEGEPADVIAAGWQRRPSMHCVAGDDM